MSKPKGKAARTQGDSARAFAGGNPADQRPRSRHMLPGLIRVSMLSAMVCISLVLATAALVHYYCVDRSGVPSLTRVRMLTAPILLALCCVPVHLWRHRRDGIPATIGMLVMWTICAVGYLGPARATASTPPSLLFVPVFAAAPLLIPWASFVFAGLGAGCVLILAASQGVPVPIESLVIMGVVAAAAAVAAWVLHTTLARWHATSLSAQEGASAYQQLLSAPGDYVMAMDRTGTILAANEQMAQRFGMTPQRIRGAKLSELLAPEVAARRMAHVQEAFATMRAIRFQDAREGIIFDHVIYPMRGNDGEPDRAITFARDITAPVRDRERAEQLNSLLRAIRDINQLITRVHDRRDLLQRACETLINARGYQHCWVTWVEEDGALNLVAAAGLESGVDLDEGGLPRGEAPPWMRECLASGELLARCLPEAQDPDPILGIAYADLGLLAMRLAHADRVFGVLAATLSPELCLDEQEHALFVELVDDLSLALHGIALDEERQAAARELATSEARYHQLVESIPSGVTVYRAIGQGLDFVIVGMNAAGERITGVVRRQVLGRPVTEVFPGVRDLGLFEVFQRVWRTGVPERHDTAHYQDDRISFWVENDVYRLESGEIVAVYQNVSRRQEAERALRESEAMLRLVMDSCPFHIYIKDREGRHVLANRALAAFHNLTTDQIEGKTSIEVTQLTNAANIQVAEGYVAADRELIETQVGTDRTIRHPMPDGSARWFRHIKLPLRVQGRDDYLLGVGMDVTERVEAEHLLQEYSQRLQERVEERTAELREAQDQLLQAERLSVLGQLAAGLGHELRNPLGAIKNASFLLTLLLPNPEGTLREAIEIIVDGVATSERIIHSLLDYARTLAPASQETDLALIVREALTRAAVPAGIETADHLPPVLPITGDPGQLVQVFLNLIQNAVQAMDGRGTLTLSSAVDDDGSICITVADTGVGIAPENAERIFEPLFTTKAKGIGLGLALTKTLVEGHGGSIAFESAVGEGTAFKVCLPPAKPS